jgi:spermidine synthase
MDEFALKLRRDSAVTALLPLFFVSGATALVYQTLWVRELQLVFGTSTFAISTVLAAFMAGLAAGGFILGRMADKLRRPLATYGMLEIGIGVYGFAFPWIVGALTPVYLAAYRALEPGPTLYGLIQFSLVGVALLLPTAMMGGTLPLLARFATQRLGAAGDRVGTLYAINTAGAVFGTWICGFVLLPTIGRFQTTVLVAAANVVLGLIAVGLDMWAKADQETKAENDLASPLPPAMLPVTIAIALAGFSSLVYEVAWTRVLGLMLGGSTYTFSVMLLAFLVGIAIGGKLGGPLADRALRNHGLARVLQLFAFVEVATAITSYALMYLYPELPFWYVWLFDFVAASDHPTAMWAVSLTLSGLVMTPPAVFMGLHFPLAVRAVVGNEEKLGGPVGTVYGANTLGGVAGAFLAGFVMLPTIGVQGTIFVAAIGNLLAAAVLLLWSARNNASSMIWATPVGLVALALFFVAQRPPWDPMLMTAGMYHYVSHFEDHTREGILDYAIGQYDLVFYEEGLSSVVTVATNKESSNMWLANNGKVDASTSTDMPTQVLCSLLPLQFKEKLDDVLIIGLASGVTAGAVTLVPDVKHMEIVELEPAIEEAAKYFKEYNHDVLNDPRVELIVNDGRNHVLLAEPGSYDIIVSEPPNPWISGVANLFTKDFLEVGKTRLKPGGVWSQWVQLYGMDDQDLQSLLHTFASVYPHVLVYSTIEEADLVLIGSESPLVPTKDKALRLMGWPKVRKELEVVGITSASELMAIYQFNGTDILDFASHAPFNTDDNMRIEYSAPMHLHVDTQDENFRLLIRNAHIPSAALPDDPDAWIELARTYRDREDISRGVGALAGALALLGPDDPRREEWLLEAEAWQAEMEASLVEDEEEQE